MYQPVERLLQVSVELQTSMALFERIFGYLDLEQEITNAPDARRLERDKVAGEVAFDSVRVSSRSYHGSDGDLQNNGETRQWTLDARSASASSLASWRLSWAPAVLASQPLRPSCHGSST